MKGLEKKNTFAKVLLIIAAVYVLAGIVMSVIGHYRLLAGMNFFEYMKNIREMYSGFYATAYTLLFILRILEAYLVYALWIMWILVIAMDKKSIRIPVIITFSYCVIRIIITLIAVLINWESIFAAFRYIGFIPLVFAAWLLLVINSENKYKFVFAILRWIVIGINILGWLRAELTYLGDLFRGSQNSLINLFSVTLEIIAELIMAAFVLWILKPELFDKKEVKGQ